MSLYDRLIANLARTRPGAWFFVHVATHIDRHVMRWTNGRISSGIGSSLYQDVVLVVTRGAKTGRERPIPLLSTPDGDRLVLIASSGGAPNHPAWYGNLKKTPQCRVLSPRGWREFEAREVEGDERTRLWELAVQQYAGYADYQARVERRIPVMVLEPLPS
jgi:deazaflavin-dependent oxidoreductase (nitroreductase family)